MAAPLPGQQMKFTRLIMSNELFRKPVNTSIFLLLSAVNFSSFTFFFKLGITFLLFNFSRQPESVRAPFSKIRLDTEKECWPFVKFVRERTSHIEAQLGRRVGVQVTASQRNRVHFIGLTPSV